MYQTDTLLKVLHNQNNQKQSARTVSQNRTCLKLRCEVTLARGVRLHLVDRPRAALLERLGLQNGLPLET